MVQPAFKQTTWYKSFILLLLGFTSGLPLALTAGTLQAWMTVEDIDLKTIGFFSLVGQAYVFNSFGRLLWIAIPLLFLAVAEDGCCSLK